jgi:hypothetical protein
MPNLGHILQIADKSLQLIASTNHFNFITTAAIPMHLLARRIVLYSVTSEETEVCAVRPASLQSRHGRWAAANAAPARRHEAVSVRP